MTGHPWNVLRRRGAAYAHTVISPSSKLAISRSKNIRPAQSTGTAPPGTIAPGRSSRSPVPGYNLERSRRDVVLMLELPCEHRFQIVRYSIYTVDVYVYLVLCFTTGLILVVPGWRLAGSRPPHSYQRAVYTTLQGTTELAGHQPGQPFYDLYTNRTP